MNRDNVLWGLVGALVGFVAAYFLFEAVGSRQPPRAIAGQPPAATAPGAPGVAGPGGPAGPGGVNAPFLEQQARELEQAAAEDPSSAQTWLDLANLRFDLQRYAPAVEAYERYLSLADPHPDVLTDLGVAYHMTGRPEDALAQFERAQQLQPDHWKSHFNEVVVLAFDLGRLDEAERVLARLRELQPENPDVERLAAEVRARRSAA
ncbi:MAG TPA: tetratricopeptide repeat protein [Thermoanaerobaculia bacterium]